MKNRNILICYALSFLKNSWFWMGVWVFYYLQFTNYAGIGLIETVLIITMTVMEIPTGAIADLVGKKITLILSFLFQALGNLFMALSGNFYHLIFSVFIGGIGVALFSGTFDALVYDTLKEQNLQQKYDKILAKNTSLQLVAVIFTGLFSGILYTLNPSLPFFVSAIFYFFGFGLAFFLYEPKIDSIKFSLNNFLIQTRQGFKGLFSSRIISFETIILLIVTGILVIADEMGESFLGVEFGFKESQIGIFFALIFLVAAFVSQLTPKLTRHFSVWLISILGVATAITFMLSPFVGLVVGGITLLVRQSLATSLNNLTSVFINQNTESKYRATTISTFNMIKNLPYVMSAYFIGSLMDIYSARNVAFFMGLLLLLSIVLFTFILKFSRKISLAKTK